jgi:hypothetical protein
LTPPWLRRPRPPMPPMPGMPPKPPPPPPNIVRNGPSLAVCDKELPTGARKQRGEIERERDTRRIQGHCATVSLVLYFGYVTNFVRDNGMVVWPNAPTGRFSLVGWTWKQLRHPLPKSLARTRPRWRRSTS